ncbi:MAG TPA: lysophospholipid acyltransferase family protein [Mycobacteriales bacterium]|nr:lysophospholipid acyltransferase family protein [Mycobacteriales bacterium]
MTPPRRRATGQRRPHVVAGSRWLGRRVAGALFRLEVLGAEHVPRTGAVLLAGNHTGFVDGPLVFLVAPRPTALLAKSEIFVRGGQRAFGWLGLIPVHRGAADRDALRAGLAVLASGGALAVFPEGTRGTGQLEKVNDGLAYLALRSGARVVPVAVLGTRDAWPRGPLVPRTRTRVQVVFGAPVTVDVEGDPRSRRTVAAAAEQLRVALVTHLLAAAAQQQAQEPSIRERSRRE